MTDITKFYIDGQWVAPRGTDSFPMINPATEVKIGDLTLGNSADVDRAVQAAQKGHDVLRDRTKAQRIDLLKSIEAECRKRFDDLAWAQTTEMGAAITSSRDDMIEPAIGQIPYFIDALNHLEDRKTLSTGDIEIVEPIGVAGLITPWNYPIYQAALKIIPALATGCACVWKPSEFCALSAEIYAQVMHDAGVPAGAFNLIYGTGPQVGSAMSKHPGIQMMSFTGSTRGGKAVTIDASDTVKRVALELGGKSPNIVFAGCDLPARIDGSINDLVLTTGQICDAPSRMLVERSIYDDAVKLAAKAADAVRVGDPTKDGPHIGPLVNASQWDRVQSYIQQGIDEGATLAAGGTGRPNDLNTGYYVRPTVFADCTPDMTIVREEIFGPVLVMLPFDTEEDAINMANDTPYGLAGYIQSGDRAQAERVAARMQAGAIHINGAWVNYGSPYGGMKQSGNGREGGHHGLMEYLELKTLHFPESF
ncbi:MAG: aldehyde dehydrogenase family protein [Pseudomonadota bacterium]